MTIRGKLLVAFGAAIVTMAAAVAGALVWVDSDSGRRFVADRIGAAVSDGSMTVRIARIDGALTSSFTVRGIEATGRDGPFARVSELSISWRPSRLLLGRLSIERIVAPEVEIMRLPPAADGDRAAGGSSSLAPGLDIEVDHVAAHRIALAEAVTGVAAEIGVEGRGTIESDGSSAQAQLDIRRIDGAGGHAGLQLDYAAHPARFAASAEIEEPSGGQLTRLLGLPGNPALSLRLDGRGPPEDWHGTLTAKAGATDVTADLSVMLEKGDIAVAVKGDGEPGPLLPPALHPLLGGRTAFDAALRLRRSGVWIVERLAVGAGVLQIDGSGLYDPQGGTLRGDLAAAARSGISLPVDDKMARVQQARIVSHVEGPLARPRATVRVTARGLEIDGMRAGEGHAAFNGSLTPSGHGAIDGSLQLTDVDLGTAVPDGLLGDAVTVKVSGEVDRNGTIVGSRLDTTTGPLTIAAQARHASDGTVGGRYSVALAPLGPLATEVGLSPDAAARLSGDFRIDGSNGTGKLAIDGELANAAPAKTPLAALLGSRLPLEARVERAADGTIRVGGIDVRLPAGTMRGSLSLAPKGDIAGEMTVAIPALSALSSMAGSELGGSGQVRIELAGPVANVGVRGTIRLDRPSIGGLDMDALTIAADGRREAAGATGRITFRAMKDGQTFPGNVRVALDDTAIRLGDIAVGTAANRITGDLRIGLSDMIGEGDLLIRLHDLSSLPLAGGAAKAAGRLDMSARLAKANGQRIVLRGNAGALRVGQGEGADLAVDGVTLDATIENALAAPRGRATVRIEKARAGDAAADRLALDVWAAGPNDYSFDGRAEGRYGVPMSLSFAGDATTKGGEIRGALNRFAGKVADVTVEMTEPLRVVWRDAARWSGRGRLTIAEGGLSMQAERTPGRLDARIDIDALPLTLAALAAPDVRLDGTLSGNASLIGPVGRLAGDLDIRVAGLQPQGAGWNADDRFTARVEMNLPGNGGDLTVTARVGGPEQTAVDLRANTPMRLALGPAGAILSADGPIDGAMTLNGQLAVVDRLIGLGENRLGGRLSGDVRFGGTVRAPEATGSLVVAGGHFESLTAGTVVRDLEARFDLAGSVVRLAKLEARDAGGGRINGEGTVSFAGSADWPIDMRLSFSRFAAVARDDATVNLSGDLRLQGTTTEPAIAGKVEIDNGEIRIPERFGGDATPLHVVEINGPHDREDGEKANSEEADAAVRIPMNIHVSAPGRVFVRGRGLDSEWRGDIDVRGTTAEPAIVGNISAVRGTFAFAGRTFLLREGRVTFTGATPPDPEIAVRAQVAVQDLTAAVVASGTASSPTIALESTPSLPSDEILSRILFGKTFGQLNAVQAAQLAQSAAELSGGLSGGGALDRIRRNLGVDVLNVGAEGSSPQGASLQAGKYITENVFVSIDQGAAAGSQKVGVEIELTPNISVETDVGPDAGSSLGVNWKWDY